MASRGCGGGARGWLLATGLALACSGAAAQDKDAAIPVEAAKVTAAPLSEQVTAIGTILSDEAVIVSSEIPGRLQEIHFQEGQPVEKGAPLFTLDDSVYRAQLADADAKLKLAEQTHKRTSQLFTNKYATAQSADESASNLAVNNAAVELARVQLEKAHIVAPFSGIVGLRRVSVGEYITAGRALVNLEAIDPVKADFRVPEKFLPAIRVGQTIRIKVDAFPDKVAELQATMPDALPISAVSGEGIDVLLTRLATEVREARASSERERPSFVRYISRPQALSVVREGAAWRVSGSEPERVVAITDLDNDEAVARLQKRLLKLGVERALEAAGARAGDEVRIGEAQFDFEPESGAANG